MPRGAHADESFRPPAHSRAQRRAAARAHGARVAAQAPGFVLHKWRAAHLERCAMCRTAPRTSQCYFRALARALSHGWRIPLNYRPPSTAVDNYKTALDNRSAVSKFLRWLVDRGRMRRVDWRPHIVSPMGVVFRTADTLRLKPRVVTDNTRAGLNAAVSKWGFRYDSVALALERFAPGAWLAKVDLAKYYTQLPILLDHQSLFGVEWEGVYYEYTSPPFGFALAPAFASWVSAEITAIARSRGINVVSAYIDDFLLAGDSHAAAAVHLRRFLALLDELGVAYGPDKVAGPLQSLVFLGVGIDTRSHQLWLEPSSVAAFTAALISAAARSTVALTTVLQLTGKLAWFASVVPALRWFARPFYAATTAATTSDVTIPPAAFTALLAALAAPSAHRVPITAWAPPATAVLLRSDAAGDIGYGAHIGLRAFARPWTPAWRACKSMTAKELWPIAEALRLFGPQLRARTVVVAMDNASAVYAICRGQSACPPSHRVLGRILALAARLHITLLPVHLPRIHNTTADALSRFSTPWSGQLPASGSAAGLPGYSP